MTLQERGLEDTSLFLTPEISQANTPPGFPWCDISSSEFDSKKIYVSDISRTEVDQIIGMPASGYFSYINSLDYKAGIQRMGYYINNYPFGFTYAHTTSDENNKLCAEIDLLYVCPHFRDKGYASIIRSLASLRILTLNPEYFVSHIADKSGKITKILMDSGYKFTGHGKGYADTDEYVLDLTSDTARKNYKEYLEMKIRRKLEGME